MIARVSGIFTLNVVPRPTMVCTSTEPPIASMFVLTTSMPTPRPEMLLTCSAVEKPGWKMTLTISRSGREAASSAVMIPFCTTLRRIALGSIPEPSSEISMIT